MTAAGQRLYAQAKRCQNPTAAAILLDVKNFLDGTLGEDLAALIDERIAPAVVINAGTGEGVVASWPRDS